MLSRKLQLLPLLRKSSFFLFGPRLTGKSTLIEQQLKESSPIINLLDSDMFFRLSDNPKDIESIIDAYDFKDNKFKLVIIDEIQKIPQLLNEVHRLIESKKINFLLTGSSARKLKKHHTNLLAGRARKAQLFPLTYFEIPNFDLNRYLLYGGLPLAYLSDQPKEVLHAYADTYLKEEVQAEALVRQLPTFTRFLRHSALSSGNMMNFANISNDTGIPAKTIREYYYLLEDTFLGFMLPAWTKTRKRKAISTAKFYYFDIGVKNIMAGIRSIDPHSDLYGQAFEHFIALEIRAYLSYTRKFASLSYWQSKNGQEVDFIIEDDIAIEVKTTNRTQDKHLKGLYALSEENICKQYYLISQDTIERKVPAKSNNKDDKIHIIHWKKFLEILWGDKIIGPNF